MPFTPRQARVSLRRVWIVRVCFGVVACTVVPSWLRTLASVAGFPVEAHTGWLPGAVSLVSVYGALMVLLMTQGRLAKRLSGRLEVTDDALTVDGTVFVQRDRIKQAVRTKTNKGSGSLVRIGAGSFPIDVELASDADADELLAALAQDIHKKTARFFAWRGGLRGFWRRFALMTGAPMVTGLGLPILLITRHQVSFPLLGLMVLLPVLVAAYFGSARHTLVVGIDGLLVRNPLRRSTFYRWEEVRGVERAGYDVLVTLASGDPLRLGFGPQFKWAGIGWEAMMNGFLARVADARAAVEAGGAGSDLAHVLAPGSRDATTWRKTLATLLEDAATYRTAKVSADQLWRVVSDPAQPSPVRAGAALALRETLDGEGKQRLRVATAACASVELQRVFEASLEDDEAKLEKALRVLS